MEGLQEYGSKAGLRDQPFWRPKRCEGRPTEKSRKWHIGDVAGTVPIPSGPNVKNGGLFERKLLEGVLKRRDWQHGHRRQIWQHHGRWQWSRQGHFTTASNLAHGQRRWKRASNPADMSAVSCSRHKGKCMRVEPAGRHKKFRIGARDMFAVGGHRKFRVSGSELE